MKSMITKFMFTFVLSTLAVAMYAQGNQNDNFQFGLTSSSGLSGVYNQDACGFGYAQFGASITEESCGDIVWGYDITPDSLGCDTITMDLTGKFVMLRRGVCNFSIKAYYAQQAGAAGVLVVNHYDGATDDGCSIIGMAPGTFADEVTIPCIFLCRDMGEWIQNELDAGNTVEGCFLLPRVSDPFAAYSYAVPVSQVDTLYNMAFNFINREATTLTGVELKADISGPNGFTASVSAIAPDMAPGLDTFLYLPEFVPPAVKGEYTVMFTNSQYTEPRDTLVRKFEITDYTYAVDNLELRLDGGADRNDLFAQGGFIYQTAAMYLTGDAGGVAKYVTFGVANIDSVYVPGDPDANAVAVLLYDGDSDGDGFINLDADFSDIAADLIGAATYTLEGDETEDGLLHVEITDFIFGGTITLQPNHPYYVSILYDGTLNGSGRNLAFSNSAHEAYLNFPTAPMFLGQFYDGGWGDRTVVQRLQMEGFDPTSVKKPNTLDVAKFSITPNPGNEFVNLNLELTNTNKQVVVNIMSAQGQLVRQEVLRNFQSGQVRFDVKDVPSGTYLMWVRTEEGQTIQKVAICH